MTKSRSVSPEPKHQKSSHVRNYNVNGIPLDDTQTSTLKSGLIPFQVNFSKRVNGKQVVISPDEQARIILAEVKRLHTLGAKTVGITYSANQGQTDTIIETYDNAKWKTGISGANQASVISRIERLLETSQYSYLQSVYRTVPITTMKYHGTEATAADDASVIKSLNNADQLIKSGGILLGWTNQTTRQGHLAIGGGVSAGVQTKSQKSMIEQWVQNKLSLSPALQQPLSHHHTPREINKGFGASGISMMVLGGFIAAVGITAISIAFTVLNAATFGVAGLSLAAVGLAATLSGVGIFSAGVFNNRDRAEEPTKSGISIE